MTEKPKALSSQEGKWDRLGKRLISRLRRSLSRQSRVEDTSDHDTLPVVLLSDQDLQAVKTAYLLGLQERCRPVYIYGLDDRRRELQESGKTLDLYALYVPPGTTSSVSATPESVSGVLRDNTRQLMLLEVVGRERHVLIRGSPGSARSMFLAFLACALSEQLLPGSRVLNSAPYGLALLEPAWIHGATFPVWIDLRRLASSEHNDGTASGVLAFIAAELAMLPEQVQRQFIEPGGLSFLFDGLDDAPQAVWAFWRRFGGLANCWFVTAPTYSDKVAEFGRNMGGFAEVHIADLNIEQMDRFVHQWYAELLHKTWIDERTARDLPGQLCTSLRRGDVSELARRHSLLTLIALLCTLRGQIAQNRAIFYEQLADLALVYWGQGHGPHERDLLRILNIEKLRMAIAQVTYHTCAHPDRRADLVELAETDLRAALASVCHEGEWPAVGELVRRILTRPGLLERCRPGFCAFPSQSLQSYVAAYYLAAQPDLPQLVFRLVHEDFYRWQQVIGFVTGHLILQHKNLDLALRVLNPLCPPSILPGWTDQSAVDKVTADEWRRVWLVGECLAQIAALFLEKDRSFPEKAVPLLGQIRYGLAVLLGGGALTPTERAKAGSVLARLPGNDPRPGVCQLEPLWCHIPRSAFWQGAGDSARIVEQDTFWIARYPVTNAQYAFFVNETGHTPPGYWQGNRPPDGIENHPVVQITWKEADAFCRWLSGWIQSGLFQVWRQGRVETETRVPGHYVVRLPTSAEWEKAARGGVLIPAVDSNGKIDNPMPQRAYPWGDSWQLSTMNEKGDETRCNVSESNIGTTTPVGMYPDGASPYGVLDMAGNVWEWCYDWLDSQAQYKIRRGGAFRYNHDQARCSVFDKAHPGLSWPYMGFRVVYGPLLPK